MLLNLEGLPQDHLDACSLKFLDVLSSLEWLLMQALSFEKDDDDNGHIDFITAASVSS